MMLLKTLKHEFVEFIPDELEDYTIYISIEYATAVHKCCCGCQSKVVTPIIPRDWKLTFDGETITLYPSIGNWNFPCRSHYWIRSSRIEWARDEYIKVPIKPEKQRRKKGIGIFGFLFNRKK